MAAGIQFQKKPMSGVHQMEGTINQPDPNARFRQNPFPGMGDPNWGVESTLPAKTPTASGGSPFDDEDFREKLKAQLAEAGADFDKADQPCKALSPVSVPGARQQPVANPSMLTTTGIPTGGSYNPYLGDPAKRKRVR